MANVSLPFPTSIETVRLRLIDLDPEKDAQPINALILDSYDTLHANMLWAEKRPSIGDTKDALADMTKGRLKGEFYNFGIFSKEHNQVIGTLGINKLRSHTKELWRDQIDLPEYSNPWVMGYWLNKHYESRGYMTEACTALLEAGVQYLAIDCYFIGVRVGNEKSANVAKRLGFEHAVHFIMDNKSRSDWPAHMPWDMFRKRY